MPAKHGPVVGLWEVTRDLFRKSAADRLGGLSAEIAFFAILSVFPGLLILVAALAWLDRLAPVDVARGAQGAILDFLGRVLTDRASGVIEVVRDVFEQQRGSVLTSAILVSAWSFSTGFAAVIRGLDLAYVVRERRSWLGLRATALALSVGSVLTLAFFVVLIVVGPLMGHGGVLAERLGMGGTFSFTWDWLRTPVAFVVLFLWTTTLYRLAPHHRASWPRGIPGAFLASALLFVLSRGFSVYLGLAAGFNRIMGVLGGGLILLIWLYLIAFSLLLGGELNAILIGRTGPAGKPGPRGSSG